MKVKGLKSLISLKIWRLLLSTREFWFICDDRKLMFVVWIELRSSVKAERSENSLLTVFSPGETCEADRGWGGQRRLKRMRAVTESWWLRINNPAAEKKKTSTLQSKKNQADGKIQDKNQRKQWKGGKRKRKIIIYKQTNQVFKFLFFLTEMLRGLSANSGLRANHVLVKRRKERAWKTWRS